MGRRRVDYPGETVTIATAEDISGAVTAELSNYERWSLYLKVADAMDITLELSPDGGTTWYEPTDSPIVFAAAGDEIIELGYDATDIRLTGSEADNVTAQVRGVF